MGKLSLEILQVIKDTPCDEKSLCKKCVAKKPSSEIPSKDSGKKQNHQEMLANPIPSTSGIQKPYTFARSKINFTMDDLEDSGGEDNYILSSSSSEN